MLLIEEKRSLTVSGAMTAVDGPVVVAVVVYGSLAVEQQSVLASLKGQGAVCAQEEGVAVRGMSVGEYSIRIRTIGCVAQNRSLC